MSRSPSLPFVLIFLLASIAKGGVDPPPAAPARPAVERPDVRWPVLLGSRLEACRKNRPVVSRVVLVPDADTWLAEVSRWSLAGQWPVLFESDPRAAAFIRAFQPQEIVRVPAVALDLPRGREQRRERMRQAVRRAWNGAPDRSAIEAFAAVGWAPPGFAVTDPMDPAWPAAVAIAAARGLPLEFVDGDLGDVDGIMDAETLAGLESRLKAAASRIGAAYGRAVEERIVEADPQAEIPVISYEWEGLGDLLDGVVVCRSMPARVKFLPPPEATIRIQGREDAADGPFAVTDALCRNLDGTRWAFAGWIWGNEARAASMAMSSIFLERRNLWFVSGYGNEPPWDQFEVRETAAGLAEDGYATLFFDEEGADLTSWRRLLLGGIRPDVLFLNSHGNATEFHLHDDERARASDVPFLDRPMALSLVHSFSAQRPANPNTVGGRFLRRGVYAYAGSVDEPYLRAFIPTRLQAIRISAGIPFLIATRHWPGEGPMAGVWKITTIGDPFMTAPRPGPEPMPMLSPDEAPRIPDGRPVRDSAREAIDGMRDDPMAGPEAIRLLQLIGEDELAMDTWLRILANGDQEAAAASARSILDPLFRARRARDFVEAYDRVAMDERDIDTRDMLWHLMMPRLAATQDADVLMLLERETRRPFDIEDLESLAPHLDRVLGEGRAAAAIQRRLEGERNEGRRTRLRRLLSRHVGS